MPKRIQLREPTEEEKREIARLAKARTEAAQLVKRAQVIQALIENPKLSPSEAGQLVGYATPGSGIEWVRRFNEGGVAGLNDRPRSGAPPKHGQTVRSQLLNLALQKPQTLGYPFALWTLERLQRAFQEQQAVHLSDSTIWNWLDEEGLHWKRQESWFSDVAHHDPAFVEKRGPSSSAT